MGKYVLSVSVILCTLVLGLALAQQKPAEPTQKPATLQQTGDVVSVDAAKNEIVIKTVAGTEAQLMISKSTKINKAGKSISIADVKAGDTLTVECEESPGGCKAKTIEVTSITPEKPSR